MTFLEAKKIVEGKGYHVVKNSEGESFRQRVAREELEEAKRIAEEAGYQLIREDEEIEDDDELDEGCCGCGGKKKKGKKKGKKSDFVPFWAKKKDKVDEALEDDLDLEGMTLDEGMILDEGFGTAEGTPLSQLCAEYIQDGYFTKLAAEVGLDVAKAEFLEKAREVTGDKYYKTLSTRIQAAKNATAVLFVLQGAMFGGSNMDLAAGTRQSAYHRNRL